MRRLATAILSVIAVVALTISAASASSVHFKGGKNAGPSFADNGLTLSSNGELSGLGNGDVIVELIATGNPTADCVNPGNGEHRPPGQQPAAITLTGVDAIPEGEIKNGTTPFAVLTAAPVTPVPGAPGCPNSNWIQNITDVEFTSATITVYQPCSDTVSPIDCPVVLSKTFSL